MTLRAITSSVVNACNRFAVLGLALSLTCLTLIVSFDARALYVVQNKCATILHETSNIGHFTPEREFSEIHSLKFLSYNVENLYRSVGRFERISADQLRRVLNRYEDDSTIEKTKNLARIVREAGPDIWTATEIESYKSALRFNREELGNAYAVFSFHGNDPRGIQIAFFVKKDLPLNVQFRSYRERKFFDRADQRLVPIFSRDLPVMILSRKETGAPYLIVIGTHAKSKRDRPGDNGSKRLRHAQFLETARIIQELRSQFGAEVPVILTGDFNGDVRTANEIDPVRNLLASAFDYALEATPFVDRITHSMHVEGQPPVYTQLDDFMISQQLFPRVLKAYVIPYRDAHGRPLPLPKTYQERSRRPSDHRAIFMEIRP